MIRWSYIFPRFLFLTLVWAFFFFAFDPILKWSLEKGMEKAAGARVDVSQVRTSFLHPSLQISGVAVGSAQNEYVNALEFSELKFGITGAPLLEKKFIIEEAALNGLKFGTPRKTSAKLLLAKKEATPKFVSDIKKESTDMALNRYDDIKTDSVKDLSVSADSLGSVKVYEELSKKYETEYAALKEKADFKEYQTRTDAIKKQYQQASQEKDPLKKIKEFSRLEKETKKLLSDFKNDKEAIEKTMAGLKGDLSAAEEARKKDIAAVMGKMKMPAFDTASLAKMLVGPLVADKTQTALKWMAMARKYTPENSQKKILKTDAKRGRLVHFPKLNALPAFLIKRMAVSGELGMENPLDYTGAIEGITTQPQIYGKPLQAEITGRKGGRAMDFKAVIDNTGETMKSEIRLKYSGITIRNLKLGDEKSIGADISAGTGALDGRFILEGEKIAGVSVFNVQNAKIEPKTANIKLEPLRNAVTNTLTGVSSINTDITISGTLKDPAISLKTDLAEKLAGAFKGAFGAELEKAKAQAQAKVDEALKPYKAKLDNMLSSRQQELSDKLKAGEKNISGFGGEQLNNLTNQAVPGKLKLPKFKF